MDTIVAGSADDGNHVRPPAYSSIRLAEREDVLRMKETGEASFQEECLTG